MGFIWTSGNNGTCINSWDSSYDSLYDEMPFWIDPTFHPYLNTTEIHCHRFVIWTQEPAFSNGSIEVLIGVSYRRGDGFRWMDNTAPDDLNFLKFNPIDNLDDEDNLTEYHCLRFSIIVNKNAKDGYETKRYECYGKNSIEYVKKSFYLLYSYSKLGSIVNADFDICNEYSSEYGSETERWNQLSPAAVPSKTLLQLLHKEILSG
ncbi:hypothetical protein DINM_022187 [Dirofilaria immitis]|nr:hypothetical protein [Dirofilaria immitis]